MPESAEASQSIFKGLQIIGEERADSRVEHQRDVPRRGEDKEVAVRRIQGPHTLLHKAMCSYKGTSQPGPGVTSRSN